MPRYELAYGWRLNDNIVFLCPLSLALIVQWVGGPVEVQRRSSGAQRESAPTRAFLSLVHAEGFHILRAALLKSSHLSLKCRNMRNNSVIAAPSSDMKIKLMPSHF